MTSDYTKEIKERLAVSLDKDIGDPMSALRIIEARSHYSIDIANLLAEREVLREALEYYSVHAYKMPRNGVGGIGQRALDALAWGPKK